MRCLLFFSSFPGSTNLRFPANLNIRDWLRFLGGREDQIIIFHFLLLWLQKSKCCCDHWAWKSVWRRARHTIKRPKLLLRKGTFLLLPMKIGYFRARLSSIRIFTIDPNIILILSLACTFVANTLPYMYFITGCWKKKPVYRSYSHRKLKNNWCRFFFTKFWNPINIDHPRSSFILCRSILDPLLSNLLFLPPPFFFTFFPLALTHFPQFCWLIPDGCCLPIIFVVMPFESMKRRHCIDFSLSFRSCGSLTIPCLDYPTKLFFSGINSDQGTILV